MMGRKNEAIRRKILAGEEVKGNCFICGKEVSGEFFCFGCREFICEDCDNIDPEFTGLHSKEAHRADTA